MHRVGVYKHRSHSREVKIVRIYTPTSKGLKLKFGSSVYNIMGQLADIQELCMAILDIINNICKHCFVYVSGSSQIQTLMIFIASTPIKGVWLTATWLYMLIFIDEEKKLGVFPSK